MNFSLAGLLAATVFGAVGIGYFVYGRRQARIVHLVCGAMLVAFPWFVANLAALLGIGIALTLAPLAAAWWFGL